LTRGEAPRRLLAAAVLAALLWAAVTPAAGARPGQPDKRFGHNGIGGESLGPTYRSIYFTKIEEEEDHSLLAAGFGGRLFHYSATGQRESDFSTRKPPSETVQAVQPDGKVIVPTESYGGWQVTRLNPDGTVDQSFHGGASEKFDIWLIQDIEVLSSGKILIVGNTVFSSSPRRIVNQVGLARLNSDGTLDRSFGQDGLVEMQRDFGLAGQGTEGVIGRPDDGVVVGGSSYVAAVRPDGTLAWSYGQDGKGRLGDIRVAGVEPTANGVAVAGSTGYFDCCKHQDEDDFFVAHITAAGQFDTAYSGGSGFATIDGGRDTAKAALFEGDGSVIVGGTSNSGDSCPYTVECPVVPALARFDVAGNPQASFGTGGLLRIEKLAATESEYQVAIEDLIARRKGGLIAVGEGGEGSSTAFLAAVTPNGILDPDFGSGGIVQEQEPEASSESKPPVLAVTPEGGILAATETNAGGNEQPGVIRYTRDGEIDRSYGDGRGYVKLGGYVGRPVALVLDRVGRSVLLTEDGTVTRITPKGQIDPGFNDGRRRIELKQPTNAVYRALAVQPDGKILVAGATNRYSGASHYRIARLLPSGHLDRSFGQGGYVTVGCHRRGHCIPAQILLPGNGQILVVGTEKPGTREVHHVGEAPSRVALIRLLPDGRPDRNFGRRGFVTLSVTNHSEAKAAILSHGHVLVAGWARPRHGSRGLLARFDLDGHLDRSFGDDGVSRAFPTGLGKPNALFFAGGRLIVGMNSEGRVAAVGFHPDGRRDRSFRCPAIRKLMRGLADGPIAAPQGGRVLLAWTEKRGQHAPTELRLTRLSSH
jgi:uncharacterized delta-60 repeat protein